VNGLFHKDSVVERYYNLEDAVAQEMMKMQGDEVFESERVRLLQRLKEMRENSHFRDFFIQHEASLRKGLQKLDSAAGRYNYFERQLLEHISDNNELRRLNKRALSNMKDEKHVEKTMEQIKCLKKNLTQTLGKVKGGGTVRSTHVADRDLGCYLSVLEKESSV